MDDTRLRTEIAAVCQQWNLQVADGTLSPQSADKFGLLTRRFRRYASASGCSSLAEIGHEIAYGFITARGRSRHGLTSDAALATQHLRRTVLRLLFRTARGLGLAQSDPTLDVHLPPRTRQRARPLTDEETDLVRAHAESRTRRTRHAAAVALADAGAHTGEIGHLTVANLDLPTSRLWVHGSGKTRPRWCQLDPWQVRILGARAELLEARHPDTPEDDLPLATSGHGSDAQLQARVCVALGDVMTWAGLADEPDVRPASITNHRAAAVYAQTGRLETAAHLLGLTSLDRTAAAIGYDWAMSAHQGQDGGTSRA